ncbi:16S rRNA (adenine(1518)-N(6)/adenine(1519)-N(6))-dimethyltransferase RsmA [Larkinella terrae]|uniref:Ribosomal RNA small subunit methyltransferase A n=1 Tax=Larkinella terrae TaxID=2025311 RepID=A0A7K0ESG7_9BACT|nr:16S rRNA (adenine(1518)-N(6)/adenine(1519)-N(6))-dimethyltransferase RsmA [Larkinella terrae]MRS64461.1 16S rRNA (adenine(1518)-N(6)/adenine(1519)-N(6))-dimethyltransferase RsmA [Larkinella terrae]
MPERSYGKNSKRAAPGREHSFRGDAVRAKKHLGQHFLKDLSIAERIAGLLSGHNGYQTVLEIGPGMGVLTQYLLATDLPFTTHVIEIDTESIAYLTAHFPMLRGRILDGDFLRMDLSTLFPEEPIAIIGNFPYNISSQILFKVLDHRQQVQEVVCMLQQEVAQRIASPPGNKDYGILSVLLQAYYDIKYEFTVDASVFSPPPKVQSGVISLRRNEVVALPCNEKKFVQVVKQGFNNRRKTLRNALKPLNLPESMLSHSLLDKRAEQLGVADFIELTNLIFNYDDGL